MGQQSFGRLELTPMTSRSEALRELTRLADGRPRQTEIFTSTDWAGKREDFWCYVVQYRVATAEGGWEEWSSDRPPSHFRTEAGAKERLAARMKEFDTPLLELRVTPKWLGYIPDADEKWIH
jgi:hypothetical protein